MTHTIAHVTAAQRELARKRLARRALALVEEISQSLAGGGLAMAARERETADVEATVTAAAAERDSAELAAIESALARMQAGRYGLCVACGAPIPWTRLDALPEVARCQHCEAALETRRAPPPSL